MKKSHISLGGAILIVLILVFLQMQRGGSTPSAPATTPPAVATQAHAATPAQGKATAQAGSSGGVTYDPSLAKYLPDPKLTPGDALDVTPQDFCVSGYSTKVRDVPESVKNQAYQEYGITSHQPGQYEVDHLISLELGGSNSIRNLWPQSYSGQWNAHMKDTLENKLHDLVCSGSLDMKTAQQAIATNWIAAYQKYAK